MGRPLSVGVDASNWQHYGGGIFNACNANMNHGVVMVGQILEKGYWIIKNSWGTGWGEGGFMKLALGNTCGVLNGVSYPTVF